MRPVIVSRGFVFIKDSQGLIKEAEYIVNNSLQEKMTTFSEIKNCTLYIRTILIQRHETSFCNSSYILNSKQTMEELQNRKNKQEKPKKGMPFIRLGFVNNWGPSLGSVRFIYLKNQKRCKSVCWYMQVHLFLVVFFLL